MGIVAASGPALVFSSGLLLAGVPPAILIRRLLASLARRDTG
jgi:hypothetical protein